MKKTILFGILAVLILSFMGITFGQFDISPKFDKSITQQHLSQKFSGISKDEFTIKTHYLADKHIIIYFEKDGKTKRLIMSQKRAKVGGLI